MINKKIECLRNLQKGCSGEVYNVVNPNTFCSIKNILKIFIQAKSEQKTKLVFDILKNSNEFGYAPNSIMGLNSDKLIELDWNPIIDMHQKVRLKIFPSQFMGIK